MLKYEFTLTAEERASANIGFTNIFLGRSLAIVSGRASMIVVFTTTLIAYGLFTKFANLAQDDVIGSAVIVAVVIVLAIYANALLFEKMWKPRLGQIIRDRCLNEEVAAFNLDEAGVEIVAGQLRTQIGWNAIVGVHFVNGLILIDIGGYAQILPSRVVDGSNTQEALLALFQENLTADVMEKSTLPD
jgi:hypothetical protein